MLEFNQLSVMPGNSNLMSRNRRKKFVLMQLNIKVYCTIFNQFLCSNAGTAINYCANLEFPPPPCIPCFLSQGLSSWTAANAIFESPY